METKTKKSPHQSPSTSFHHESTRWESNSRVGPNKEKERARTSDDPYCRNFIFQKYQKQAGRSVGSRFWGEVFRSGNPIHSLLSIESETVSPQDSWRAYAKLARILSVVKEVHRQVPLSPQEKLKLVYETMTKMGLRFGDMTNPLLTQNLNAGQLDCDTSSFVVMAVAHEMGWPVHLVVAPNHVFVRWDDGKGIRFNMDYGEIHSDEDYIKKMGIPAETIRGGIHLKSLNPAEMCALFLHNRGTWKADRGKFNEAIEDLSQSLSLNPRYADSYLDRGQIRMDLGQYTGAREDLSRAERLDPRFSGAQKNVEYTERFRKILK